MVQTEGAIEAAFQFWQRPVCVGEWECFNTAVGAVHQCRKVLSQSQNLSNWPSDSQVTYSSKTESSPQQMSYVLRDIWPFLWKNEKRSIFPCQSPTVKGIRRSKMSCLKGSTVDACRIFFSLLSVSTTAGRRHHVSLPKDSLVVQVSRAECWLWLSRTPHSLHHSKPIFDELQSPHSVAL